MTIENDNTQTVSQTLDHTFAYSISNIQGIIDSAPGLYIGSPERLAELVQMAHTLEHKTERLWAEIGQEQTETEVNGEPETTADVEREINEMAAELNEGAETAVISGGDAYDDVMLVLERADALLMAINDVSMSGEEPNLVSLTALAREQIATVERICQANSGQWSDSVRNGARGTA